MAFAFKAQLNSVSTCVWTVGFAHTPLLRDSSWYFSPLVKFCISNKISKCGSLRSCGEGRESRSTNTGTLSCCRVYTGRVSLWSDCNSLRLDCWLIVFHVRETGGFRERLETPVGEMKRRQLSGVCLIKEWDAWCFCFFYGWLHSIQTNHFHSHFHRIFEGFLLKWPQHGSFYFEKLRSTGGWWCILPWGD